MQRPDREQEQINAPGGPTAAPARTPDGPQSLNDHVLSMQRDYGNTAVSGMVVQRKPRKQDPNRPQSTDIKDTTGYKAPKKGKAAPKPKGPEMFWPTEPHVTYGEKYEKGHEKAGQYKYSELDLRSRGGQSSGSDNTNSNWLAVGMLEEAFRRRPALDISVSIYRSYAKLKGEEKRAEFWKQVQHRATGYELPAARP